MRKGHEVLLAQVRRRLLRRARLRIEPPSAGESRTPHFLHQASGFEERLRKLEAGQGKQQ